MSNTKFKGQDQLYCMPAAENRYNSQKSRQVAQMGRKKPEKGLLWGLVAPSFLKICELFFYQLLVDDHR